MKNTVCVLSILILYSIKEHEQVPINTCTQYTPYCSKCYDFELICTNFTSFEQLNFTDNFDLKKQFNRVDLRPLGRLVLDDRLNLSGLILTTSAQVQIGNIKQFVYDFNPFKNLIVFNYQNRFMNLIIDNSTLEFIQMNSSSIQCDNVEFGDYESILSSAYNIKLTNIEFPMPLCSHLFNRMDVENFEIISPTSTHMQIQQSNQSTQVNAKVSNFLIRNATIDSLNGFNKYLLLETQKLLMDNTVIDYLSNGSFSSLKNLRQIDLVNFDFKKMLHGRNGIDWLRSLNPNISVNLNNPTDIIYNLERFNYVKLVLRKTAYSFPNEDFCLLQNYPLEHLILFLVTLGSKEQPIECTCTLLWLMQIEKYYSYIPGNGVPGNDLDLVLPINLQYCVRQCRCDFDKAISACKSDNQTRGSFNVFCPASTTIKPRDPSTKSTTQATTTTTTKSTTISNDPNSSSHSLVDTSTVQSKCPQRCKCIEREDTLVDLSCDQFDSFKDLNIVDTGLVHNTIVLKPSVYLNLDETLDLSQIQLSPNATLILHKIKSFSIAHYPFGANQKLAKLIIENSIMSFKHDSKFVDTTKICDSLVPRASALFRSITDSIHLVNILLEHPICPFVFGNVKITTLELRVSSGVLEFVPVKIDRPLNCSIENVKFENLHVDVLDDLTVLNRHVFSKAISVSIDNSHIKRIDNQVFKHYEQLKHVRFQNVDFKRIVQNGNDWLRSLNPLVTTHFNQSGDIIKQIENKEFVSLVLKEIDYKFPDEDFCLFEHFPFDKLIYLVIEPLECTCTLLWISKNNRLYTTNPDECIQNEKVPIEKCDFDGELLRNCVTGQNTKLTVVLIGIFAGLLVVVFILVGILVRICKKKNSNYTSLRDNNEVKMDMISTEELKKAR